MNQLDAMLYSRYRGSIDCHITGSPRMSAPISYRVHLDQHAAIVHLLDMDQPNCMTLTNGLGFYHQGLKTMFGLTSYDWTWLVYHTDGTVSTFNPNSQDRIEFRNVPLVSLLLYGPFREVALARQEALRNPPEDANR